MLMDYSNSENTFIINTAFWSKLGNFRVTSLSTRFIISWQMTSAERPDLGLFSKEFRLNILLTTLPLWNTLGYNHHTPMDFFGVCTFLVRNFMTTLNSIIWLSIFACVIIQYTAQNWYVIENYRVLRINWIALVFARLTGRGLPLFMPSLY